MKDLRGKNAIVTGGSRGIGPYIGRALAAEGLNLALAARLADKLEAVAKELGGLGVRTVAIPTDITDEASRHALIQCAEAELGQIDILVNNAARSPHVVPFARQEQEGVRDTIEVNLLAHLSLTRLLLSGMLERGRGHIVTISSMAGKTGIPYWSVYAASKAAIIAWTNALRVELEGTGVGASVICSSYVSDVGMWAFQGYPAPRLPGPVLAKDVAKAIVRAVRRDVPEVRVASVPTRPLLVLMALSPALGNLIIKAMGVVRLQRQLANQSEEASVSTGAQTPKRGDL